MERKNIFASAVFLLLTLLNVWLYFDEQRKEENSKKNQSPIATFAEKDVAFLEVTQPGKQQRVVLKKEQQDWWLDFPKRKPADSMLVAEVVKGLSGMKWRKIASESKAMHDSLEVSEEKAIHVIAKNSAGQVLINGYVGKSLGGGLGVAIRLEGKEESWGVDGITSSLLKRDANRWREHRIAKDVNQNNAETFIFRQGYGPNTQVVEFKKKKIEKKQENPGTKQASVQGNPPVIEKITEVQIWERIEGGQPKEISPEMQQLVAGVVSSLSQVKANDYVDEETNTQPEKLLETWREFTVDYTGNKHVSVGIGNCKEDGSCVLKDLSSGEVFRLLSYAMSDINYTYKDFMEEAGRRGLDIQKEEIAKVRIQKKGKETFEIEPLADGWQIKGVTEVHSDKVKAYIEGLPAILSFSMARYGLPSQMEEIRKKSEGELEIIFKESSKKKPIVVGVGKSFGDFLPVFVSGGAPLLLKEITISKLLPDLGELKNAPSLR